MPLVSPNNDLILAGIQDDILCALCHPLPSSRTAFFTTYWPGSPSFSLQLRCRSRITCHPNARLHRPSTSEGAGGCHHRHPNSTHACTSPTPQTNLRMTVPPATTVPPVPPSLSRRRVHQFAPIPSDTLVDTFCNSTGFLG